MNAGTGDEYGAPRHSVMSQHVSNGDDGRYVTMSMSRVGTMHV